MASKGLDERARHEVAALVEGRKDGSYVRTAIDHRVRSDRFDYTANVRFLSWLRSKRYEDTATNLARYLDG